jgi:hypothetical protein
LFLDVNFWNWYEFFERGNAMKKDRKKIAAFAACLVGLSAAAGLQGAGPGATAQKPARSEPRGFFSAITSKIFGKKETPAKSSSVDGRSGGWRHAERTDTVKRGVPSDVERGRSEKSSDDKAKPHIEPAVRKIDAQKRELEQLRGSQVKDDKAKIKQKAPKKPIEERRKDAQMELAEATRKFDESAKSRRAELRDIDISLKYENDPIKRDELVDRKVEIEKKHADIEEKKRKAERNLNELRGE